MANYSLPTGSISPWMFYICCPDWLYPPSVQQRWSCFLLCRVLLFSLLPGRTHTSCVSPQVFPLLFCKQHKILCKPDDLVSNLHIEFSSNNLPPCGLCPFPHIWHMYCPLQASLWCPYFWHLKHLRGSGTYCSTLSKQLADLHLLGSMMLIKCQDISVDLDSFFAFSNGDSSNICNSLFS